MRLLIVTQKVDKDDPVLGFFHRWLIEFAKNCELIIVVCLQKGNYDLPKNIKVLSLGKEKSVSKFKYIFNFYKFIFQERNNYEKVFVHMNQEYVILGGIFWKLLGKKIYFWRNHRQGNWLTQIAIKFANTVYCTSRDSYTYKFTKTKLMPVGIDTDYFVNKTETNNYTNNRILYLGRISPVKKIEILLDALSILKRKNVNIKLTIVGGPATLADQQYKKKLQDYILTNNLSELIDWQGAVENYRTVDFYNKHDLFVNLTPTGSMDKTIFEAMACQCLVLVINSDFVNIITKELSNRLICSSRPEDLAAKINLLLNLPTTVKKEVGLSLRQIVEDNHSLSLLMGQLLISFR